MTAAPPVTLSPHVWRDLAGNRIFMTGLASWAIAQILKVRSHVSTLEKCEGEDVDFYRVCEEWQV